MAMIDLKGLHVVTSKGRTYVYAWRGGPRLSSAPGTPEFAKELADAVAARTTGDRTRISGLVALFKASDDWKGFGNHTRKTWVLWLDRIQTHFGKLPIAAFDRPLIRVAIRKWRDRYRDTPAAADLGLTVLSRLLSFAMAEGLLQNNPCSAVARIYSSDRSGIIWTAEDLDALAVQDVPAIFRAAKLASLCGLRRNDLLKLSWNHIGPLAIEIRTGKSKERKTTLIPLYGELRAYLDTIPKTGPIVLANSRGLPWKSGFSSSWQKAIKAAGVDKHFHDLRGTAATRMYIAGLTIREIAEIFTWSEDYVERLINRYVKKDELLRDRIRRMDEAESRTSPVKPPVKPGRTTTS